MGRHYRDDEALEFWLHSESDNRNLEVTPELQQIWDDFGEALFKSLTKHLGATKTDEIYEDEGWDSVTSDVYATLTGSGIGIWDGRWDGYLTQPEIKELEKKLKKDVGKFADDSGAGLIGTEMMNIAFAEGGSEDNPRKPPIQKKLKARLLR